MKKDHTKSIIDTSLEQAKMWGNAEYMEGGLVLTDRIADAPIPDDPTRLNFILMALCKKDVPSTVLTHASKRSIPATCYSSLNGTS